MDSISISKRATHTNRKGNKENTQPCHEKRDLIKKDKNAPASLHMKSSFNKETLAKKDPLKARGKWADVKTASSNAPKQIKTVQSDGKEATALSEKAASLQKINNTVAPKPLVKATPGMYKGKIIQSKIGSIWKSSSTSVSSASQPTAPKPQNHRAAKVPQSRSKSVSEMSESKTQKPTLPRSAANSHPAGFYSARPPARTVTATLTTASSRKAPVIPTKGSVRPKMSAPDKKVNKPPVSSSVSQYRVSMESAEERRAKLAEWMASKGKTTRRPAMTTTAPAKVKVAAKPKGELVMQNTDDAPAKAELRSAPEACTAAAAHRAHTQEAEPTVQSQTPQILDTYLDLLESSDTEQLDGPQDRVDDIVVNLWDALEAMATPSCCSDEPTQILGGAASGSGQLVEGGAEQKLEVLEGVCSGKMKEEEEEEGENQKVKFEDECKFTEDATVIKYTVTTTSSLQRAKLAEWMASKGKTTRRPAMTTTAPAKVKVAAKPKGELIMQNTDDAPAKAEIRSAPEACTAAAAHRAHTQEAEPTVQSQTPQILDTYLDLLESSDTEQLDGPQDRVDDIVVNLCDALEAMATPSCCSDEPTQILGGAASGSGQLVEGGAEQKLEVPEGVCSGKMKEEEEEEGENKKVKIEDECKFTEDATVIKYTVTTTPYLQRMKKILMSEGCSGTARKKVNIKDLKFLTPVRRSSRIQRRSCLPSAVVDHYPCVASLAELFNDDANAYICRKNPALIEDRPDLENWPDRPDQARSPGSARSARSPGSAILARSPGSAILARSPGSDRSPGSARLARSPRSPGLAGSARAMRRNGPYHVSNQHFI